MSSLESREVNITTGIAASLGSLLSFSQTSKPVIPGITTSSALILVIEDNPDDMKLVTWALEDAGYHFLEATSAEDSLELLERYTVDLVLMELSLPRMDGT